VTSLQASGRSRRFDPPTDASDRSRRIALVVAAAGLVAFAVVGLLSYGKSYLAEPVDLWWNDLMLENRTDVGLVVAWVPAVVGGPIAMLIIGLVLVGTFLFLRWKHVALTVACAMVASVAIASPLAAAVARTRPEGSLAETVPTSFPSGHTAMAATVAVVLALVFRSWVAWVLGVAWVIVMGWSRTYLQAHWLTDVLAGAFLGLVAGMLVWWLIETARLRRAPQTVGR
jgi:membrane-associated phospholipid phosphatase